MTERRGWYAAGLFWTTLAALLVEVLDTRFLSVATWYHLSFFAVSTALFGLSAGAVHVYVGRRWFARDRTGAQLSSISIAFALSIPLTHLLLLHIPLRHDLGAASVLSSALLAALLLAVPFYLAGILVALALTRYPGRIGAIYAVDLIGAAAGCLLAVPLLDGADISTAMFAAGAAAGIGALLYQPLGSRPRRGLAFAGSSLALLLAATAWNAVDGPAAVRMTWEKGELVNRSQITYEGWNSHSQVLLYQPRLDEPQFWGRGKGPPPPKLLQARLQIDGSAYTFATQWNGDPAALAWVQSDVTSVAYHLRRGGEVAIIGVGGGRDVLAAVWARSPRVVGIELNGLIVELLRTTLREFARLADRPELELHHDEARSFLSRERRRFDVLQMSLVDSWASTSAGAFTLSENGLYTVEAWELFLERLTPTGVLTASRWFSKAQISETSRLLALGVEALLRRHVAEPQSHLILLARDTVANLLVSPTPFSAADLKIVAQLARSLDFDPIVVPHHVPPDAGLAAIARSRTLAELRAATRHPLYDFAPPTDERPYFFNMIRPRALFRLQLTDSEGVVEGNLIATLTLLSAIAISTVLLALVVFLPLWVARRRETRAVGFGWGLLYFALIGAAYMLVQIPFVQRFSPFLGHPTYAIIVILSSMILFTGLGSLLSERVAFVERRALLYALPLAIAAAVLLERFAMDPIMRATLAHGLGVRCATVLAFSAPLSLLCGCCFPVGMKLVSPTMAEATPWFWAVNGATGVLASAIAVAISMWLGIDVSFAIAALLYASLALPAARLSR